MSWLAPLYLWIKAVHVVAVIAWMAGVLYLPRLFVYHVDAEPGSVQSETFKLMEYRLYRYITTPAMTVAFVLGAALASIPGVVDWRLGWGWSKFALAILLIGYTHALGRWRRDFARDANKRSARFYRIANEAPTVLMIAIVILVIVKPF